MKTLNTLFALAAAVSTLGLASCAAGKKDCCAAPAAGAAKKECCVKAGGECKACAAKRMAGEKKM